MFLGHFLGHFNQLHLAIFGAMQDHHLSLGIAKYEYGSVLEVSLLDRFF